MVCCPSLSWCTAEGPVEVAADGDGVYTRPAGASGHPFRSLVEAIEVCPYPLLETCAECSFKYRSVWSVSVENCTGMFLPGVHPMYVGGLSGGAGFGGYQVTDCQVPARATGIRTSHTCLAGPGGVDAPLAWTLDFVFNVFAMSDRKDRWMAWSQCFTLSGGVAFLTAASGYSLEPVGSSVLSQVVRDSGFTCGTAEFISSRRFVGRVGVINNSGVEQPGFGGADVFVQP